MTKLNEEQILQRIRKIMSSDEAFYAFWNSELDDENAQVALYIMDVHEKTKEKDREQKTKGYYEDNLKRLRDAGYSVTEIVRMLGLSVEDGKQLIDINFLVAHQRAGLSQNEIGEFYGCTRKTIQRKKAAAIEKGFWPITNSGEYV